MTGRPRASLAALKPVTATAAGLSLSLVGFHWPEVVNLTTFRTRITPGGAPATDPFPFVPGVV